MNPLSPAVAALLTCLLLSLANCQGDRTPDHEVTDSSEVDTSIPFSKEGTLTIHPDRDLDPVTIDIEIADTDSSRARGLMQRSSLPDQSGMLFIFEEENPQSFWMANTQLSLDMMFIKSNRQIVNIAKYTRPGSSDHIRSGEPVQYVLEVPAGFADRHGIVEGDSVSWERVDPE
jgi:uncharacterized membrane protein (UPF0127 family)